MALVLTIHVEIFYCAKDTVYSPAPDLLKICQVGVFAFTVCHAIAVAEPGQRPKIKRSITVRAKLIAPSKMP